MRTTLTLIGDRVAGADDFPQKERKTAGRHLFVDFEIEDHGVQLLWVGDLATNKTAAPDLSVDAMNAIQRHCRAYPNMYASIFAEADVRARKAKALVAGPGKPDGDRRP